MFHEQIQTYFQECQMDTRHYVLLTGYLAIIPHTSYSSAFIHIIGRITAVRCQLEEIERAAVKMFAVLSQEKWAGSTSIFSWLRCILLKYCLFWAQTQNTSVSDGLGKQINKQANIDCSFVFVYMGHMCLLFMPNKIYLTLAFFSIKSFQFYQSQNCAIVLLLID